MSDADSTPPANGDFPTKGTPNAASGNLDKAPSCTAHLSVHCAASLPPGQRKKMLGDLRAMVQQHDPSEEHKKWSKPMGNVPPSVAAKALASWVRNYLFVSGGAEKVKLMPTTSLSSEDTYYYEWDDVTQRWYLVCTHSLNLSEYDSNNLKIGNQVRFDFDAQFPEAHMTIVIAYRPGKAHASL